MLWVLNPDLVEVETLPSNAFPEMRLQKCHGCRINEIRENDKTGTSSALSCLTDTPSSLPLKIDPTNCVGQEKKKEQGKKGGEQ